MDVKIKKIIDESANQMHFDVAALLEDGGWEVEISPYYIDDLTDRPREIDIIARKEIPLTGAGLNFISNGLQKFWVVLFIECKHLKEPAVFWMHKNTKAVNALVISNYDAGEMVGGAKNKFHYFSFGEKVGKLFDTNGRDKETLLFNGLTQPIKSLLFYKARMPLNGVYYPIMVYDGQDSLYTNEGNTRNMLMHINYSYKNPSGSSDSRDFYVDIIHKDELGNFLDKTLSQELEEMNQKISWSVFQSLK